MSCPELVLCPNANALAAAAAELAVRAASAAVQARGRFTWVLSGGTTPAAAYALLAQPPRTSAIDWTRTWLFFGDERFVPPADPRSNYRMVQDALLARVPIPPSHVFPIRTDHASAAVAAAAYERDLRDFFGASTGAPPPSFDLVWLGLGADGHTAGLFPRAPALQVRDSWVTSSPPGVLPPAVDRMTLTYPVLNAAREVVFLVAGQQKARSLSEAVEQRADPLECPAAGIRPVAGRLAWLVDRPAASALRDRRA